MRTLLFVVLSTLAHAACAASLSINPVRLNLSAQQPVGSLTLTNQGTETVVLQLDAAAWSQADGTDIDTPTDELLATPPLVSVAPGASQLVRVGLRHPTASAQERSYRIFLQEVPVEAPSNRSALQFRLRFAVPVFVPATAPGAPSLTWDVAAHDGVLTVRAHNASPRHVQVIALAASADDRHFDVTTSPSYVLPGQTRQWTRVWTDAARVPLHLDAITDAGPMQADVPAPSR